VKHESEGYPDDAPVPDYRIIHVSYTGTFLRTVCSGINNAPIPSYLIEKFAGERWTHNENRQSISAIDELVKGSAGSGSLQINATNLILLAAREGLRWTMHVTLSPEYVTRAQLVSFGNTRLGLACSS